MATATDADATDPDSDDLTRPRFRGCVFCYSAQMLAYGVRKLRQ
ncbi:hypothetical protein ACFR97_05890 [Haloplanus litoreus]|uniref:Uncharacterized protein n=1 Tax=Haloplanus litoreus TaxID=767515 RepID=A0ABD5ZWU7_9EURY